jgi:hypothetical protein
MMLSTGAYPRSVAPPHAIAFPHVPGPNRIAPEPFHSDSFNDPILQACCSSPKR